MILGGSAGHVLVPIAAVTCVLLVACGSDTAAGSCDLSAEWQERSYGRVEALRPVPMGEALEGGGAPACPDEMKPADLRAIEGVPPRVALARAGDERGVYLADGFLPELPGHPAHAILYGGPRRPALAGRRGCRTVRRPLTGTLIEAAGGRSPVLRVPGRKREVVLSLDAATKVRAPEVDGLPHLDWDDRVRVRLRTCSGRRQSHVVISLRVLSSG